jgi:hypothetical protein
MEADLLVLGIYPKDERLTPKFPAVHSSTGKKLPAWQVFGWGQLDEKWPTVSNFKSDLSIPSGLKPW